MSRSAAPPQPGEPDSTRRLVIAKALKPDFFDTKPLDALNLDEMHYLGVVHLCADVLALVEEKGTADQKSDARRMAKKFLKAKKYIQEKGNNVAMKEVIDGDYIATPRNAGPSNAGGETAMDLR